MPSLSRHIAFFGPLPPDQSGVADYNAALLRELSKRCSIEVFTDRPDKNTLPTDNYPVYPIISYTARAIQQPFDLNLYQLSNSTRYGTPYYKALLRRPGLTVFHDLSLFDMFWNLYLDADENMLFWQTLRDADGDEMCDLLRQEIGKVEIDRLRYPMIRQAVVHSTATIVHSPWAADQIHSYRPTLPVFINELGGTPLDPAVGTRLRTARGWSSDQLVIAVLGRLDTTTHPHVTLAAFETLHRKFPNTRLIIAGFETVAPDYVRALRARVEAAGLGEAVYFPSNAGQADFEACIQAADVIVTLRWPHAGGSSAVMASAFAAGKCVIASDTPQFWNYNPAYCWSVPVTPDAEAAALLNRLYYAASHLAEVRAAGKQAADFASQQTAWPIVAARYMAAIEHVITTRMASRTAYYCPPDGIKTEEPVTGAALGIQFMGDLATASGLSESRVAIVDSLLQAGVAVNLQPFSTHVDRSINFPSAEDRTTAFNFQRLGTARSHYPITLLGINIHEIHEFLKAQDWQVLRKTYKIATWLWELTQLSAYAYQYVGRVDEIWASSRFAAYPFAQVTGAPVTMIPLPVSVTVSPNATRAQFGLDPDRYVFFFNFSALSTDARKNPWAVIEAFRKAFGKSAANGPQLVLKVHHAAVLPELQHDLRAAVDTVGGVMLEENYTRQQMNDLLSCIDTYVSLHRSEGFGLGMAEAMYLGKPVVATDYSGNTDFLSAENGYPVRYTLRFIDRDVHRYRPEAAYQYNPLQIWAEADTDHAAALMSMLYHNPDRGRTIGLKAAESIRRYCSPPIVGQLMKARLTEITQSLPGLSSSFS